MRRSVLSQSVRHVSGHRIGGRAWKARRVFNGKHFRQPKAGVPSGPGPSGEPHSWVVSPNRTTHRTRPARRGSDNWGLRSLALHDFKHCGDRRSPDHLPAETSPAPPHSGHPGSGRGSRRRQDPCPTRIPPPVFEAVERSFSRFLPSDIFEDSAKPCLYLCGINGRHILAAISRCLQTLPDRLDPRHHEPPRLAIRLGGQSVCNAAKLKLLKPQLQTRHF